MSFSAETKTEMFIKSARLCCLCLKPCGTNIEAAHIIDKFRGGGNEEDNGIPVCFDCHQEIGAYDDKHPKGNKFRPRELKARRDRVYNLVDSGALLAQQVAAHARASGGAAMPAPALPESDAVPTLSAEGGRVLSRLKKRASAAVKKLRLLSSEQRALVVDELLRSAPDNVEALRAVSAVVEDGCLGVDATLLLAERLVRAVALSEELEVKAVLLEELSTVSLLSTDAVVREALYDELIDMVARDQFDEVNRIVEPLVRHHEAVPDGQVQAYLTALLAQARSSSYHGRPAATAGLQKLPTAMARDLAGMLTFDELCWIGRLEHYRPIVAAVLHLAVEPQRSMLEDAVKLTYKQFHEKYSDF